MGTGIAGLSLGVLNSMANGGGLGGLFGNGTVACSENHNVNRYELGLENKIATLEADKKLLESTIYTDGKLLEVYKYFDGELKDVRATMCANDKAQAVINAKFESGFDVLSSQVASINGTIAGLTRTVIPNANVCPGWGAVNVVPTGGCCVNGYNANV